MLGAAVRRQRRQLGLRQTVLADLAGVGVAFLYDLEKGKPTLRIDKVLSVLEALGLGLTVAPSSVLVRSDVAPGEQPAEDPT
ncbi:MAG: type II toxin-antitoxin system Y4mF family antitoxin [Planctomycetota bacterium]